MEINLKEINLENLIPERLDLSEGATGEKRLISAHYWLYQLYDIIMLAPQSNQAPSDRLNAVPCRQVS